MAGLTAYLNGGGGLLYAGGHCLYSEPYAASFVANYLGLRDWQGDMPTFHYQNAPAFADGTGGPIAGAAVYNLNTWAGGWYGGTMFTGFGILQPTVSAILKFRTTNLYGVRPNAPYAAAINETSTSPSGPYGLGSTSVTLTITDKAGASASCSSTVTVVDVTPPTVTCNAPATITPPQTPLSQLL